MGDIPASRMTKDELENVELGPVILWFGVCGGGILVKPQLFKDLPIVRIKHLFWKLLLV